MTKLLRQAIELMVFHILTLASVVIMTSAQGKLAIHIVVAKGPLLANGLRQQ